MGTREDLVHVGEVELRGSVCCPICAGAGHYACVHCDRVHAEEIAPRCPACAGHGEHTCIRCLGAGHVKLYEEEYDDLNDADLGDGYRLQTWDTNSEESGLGVTEQTRLAYRLSREIEGTNKVIVIFESNEYKPSRLHGIDSEETVRDLIGWLTLQPGDTDADYFDRYTEVQWDFANGDAEQLGLWADPGGDELKQWGRDDFLE